MLVEVPFVAIEFDAMTRSVLGLAIALAFFGVVTNAIFVWHLQKDQAKSNAFTLSVAVADGLNAVFMFVFHCIHLHYNHFATGALGCQIFGFQYQLLSPASVISFLCTPLNSILVVLQEREALTTTQTNAIILVIWGGISLSSAAVALFPGSLSASFQLGSSGLYCTSCYTSTTPLTLIVNYADALGSFLNPLFLMSIFLLVLHKIREAVKVLNKIPHSIRQAQKRVATRGVILVSLHMLSYFSTTAKITYEMIFKSLCPVWLDILAHILHLFSLSANPLVFYILDGHGSRHLALVTGSTFPQPVANAEVSQNYGFASQGGDSNLQSTPSRPRSDRETSLNTSNTVL
ncbi:hypothetical protein HDU91_002208 [Kappamyces sp. JEL0680]|nr:hypothetical protein HDU91_002208 [Kappamyces sp. JEL0680]